MHNCSHTTRPWAGTIGTSARTLTHPAAHGRSRIVLRMVLISICSHQRRRRVTHPPLTHRKAAEEPLGARGCGCALVPLKSDGWKGSCWGSFGLRALAFQHWVLTSASVTTHGGDTLIVKTFDYHGIDSKAREKSIVQRCQLLLVFGSILPQ